MYTQIDSNKRNTFLLVFIFLIVVIALGWVFSYAFDNQIILFAAVIISIFQAFISYYYSDSITLAISGAREVARKDNIELHRLVENLAITAGIPKPRVYLIEDSAPNAFATGRDPEHAVICVTSGLVDKLNKRELEGVISHEMAHIGNYDIRLMTITVVLVGIIALLSNWFLRWSWWGGRRRSDGDNNQAQAIMLVVGIVLAILAPVIASLIKLAISRKREYLADATGALMTRYPDGLADALEKISKDDEPLEAANNATAHLYIASPLKDNEKTSSWFSNMFDTHPPIEDRIKKLRSMIGK